MGAILYPPYVKIRATSKSVITGALYSFLEEREAKILGKWWNGHVIHLMYMYQGYETNTTSTKPNQKRTRTQFFLNPKPIKGIEIYFRETLRTFSTIWTMKLMINKLYLKMQNIAIMDPTDESGISMDLNIFKDPRAQREMHILVQINGG